jgi:hypothetical protein
MHVNCNDGGSRNIHKIPTTTKPFSPSRCKWNYEVKMDLSKEYVKLWTGLIRFRSGTRSNTAPLDSKKKKRYIKRDVSFATS